MKSRIFGIIFLLAIASSALIAQNDQDPLQLKKYLTVSGGIGMSSYYGDLGSNDISSFNDFKGSYNIGLSKRFGEIIEIGLGGQFGKLSQNQRNISINYNFETKYTQLSADINIHFDRKGLPFSPYLGSGLGYMSYEVFSDLKDGSDREYFYWSDGVIRSLPEFDVNGNRIAENKYESEELSRDYTYETSIDKTTNKKEIQTTSLIIPIRVGVKFQLTDFIDTRLALTYFLTQTDHLDFIESNSNDSYLYANATIAYTIGKKEKSKEEIRYKDFDFKSLLMDDSDNDGIPDTEDQCAQTPSDVSVDIYGCPTDNDEDGIPDFKDKELTTKRGAVVDEYGVTLTDEEIYKRKLKRDSIYSVRVVVMDSSRIVGGSITLLDICGGSMENVVPGSAFIAIPSNFRFADQDANGIICPPEVYNVIDSYLDGSNLDLTVSDILGIIDFYFEQDVELKLD